MSGYALPRSGEVFFDARGEERTLRLSWHPDVDLVVLSLWHRGTCTATFRMPSADLAGFIEALAQGLPTAPRGRRHAAPEPETAPDLIPDGDTEFPLTGQYHHPR